MKPTLYIGSSSPVEFVLGPSDRRFWPIFPQRFHSQPAPWVWRHLSRAARRPDSLIAQGHAGESLTTVGAHRMGWL